MRFRDAQSVSLVSIHHLDYSTYLALVYLTSHSELQSALLSWLPYVCNSHDSDDCLDLETCSLSEMSDRGFAVLLNHGPPPCPPSVHSGLAPLSASSPSQRLVCHFSRAWLQHVDAAAARGPGCFGTGRGGTTLARFAIRFQDAL
jgi:hypothetical protein